MQPYYDDGQITVYLGDCREVLPSLERCDLLLTDPPYGINAARHRNSQASGWVDYGSPEDAAWDAESAPQELIDLCLQKADKAVVWGGNYWVLPPSTGWLIWDKGQRAFSLADGEMAWTSEQRAVRIYDLARSVALQDGRVHPTQKPLALMRWCIEQFPEARTVLDPFAGSLTTAVAAKHTGRRCIAIERHEPYIEAGIKRLAQAVLL